MVAAPPMASAPLLCLRLRLGTATANLASGVGGGCCAQVGRTQRRRMRVGVRWRRRTQLGAVAAGGRGWVVRRRRRWMRPLGWVAALTRASARAAGMRDDWLGAA